MRRILTGAITVTMAATLGAFALPTGSQAFTPISHGTTLPATVSADQPVRVVTTALDPTGRPVISVREATTAARAADLIALSVTPSTVGVEIDSSVHAAGAPAGSDPLRAKQWDLDTMNVAGAWQRSTGAGVTVAVIDSGVDGNHPDLKGQVLAGYDAIRDVAGGGPDENGHGTHVAGTVAALTGNARGVAGVAPDARILPVKVLDAEGSGNSSDTAQGIVWAVDHGAQVINMSLGGTKRATAIGAAVAYAHQRGVTVVAAAGNEREDGSPTNWPAAEPNVIAVAATDKQDRIANYSTRGDYVDVAAPGSGIVSTYPSALGSEYVTMSGTSMATPHVAAVAALLLAEDPGLTPARIEQILESTAADLGPAGFDSDFGHGRIDAAAALGAGAGDRPAVPEILVRKPSAPVAYGTRAVTGFRVRVDGAPAAGRTVRTCVSAGGGAWKCTTTRTGADGSVSVSRQATGAYRVRLDVPATGSVSAASATVGYTVKAVVTAARSGTGAITVRVGGAAGQKMTVQRYQNKTWKTVKTYPATSSRKVTGLVRGGSYRIVLARTTTVLGVTTGTVKA